MSELRENQENKSKSSSQDYEELLKKYQFRAGELSPGKLVKGTIIKITPSHVLVDISSKSEGIIPLEDFTDKKDLNSLNLLDNIEAILERSNLKEGYFILSQRKATALKALNNLE